MQKPRSLHDGELEFTCNVCGEENRRRLDSFERENTTCEGCGSTVRSRSLLYMLSREIFGMTLPLPEFPTLKGIRGLGLSDTPDYACGLAQKFDYTNTFYARPPQFDIMNVPEEQIGRYDFLIASEIFEHVSPPIEDAFRNACRILKPSGVLLFSVPYTFEPETTEHYPDLYDYSVVDLAGRLVLVNRTRDGRLQVFDNPVFHGGLGLNLEIRRFSEQGLRRAFTEAGFSGLQFYDENYLPFGILHRESWSLPLVVRKQAFTLDRNCVTALVEQFRQAWQAARQCEREMTEIAQEREAKLERRIAELGRMYVKVEAEMQERSRWALKLEGDLKDRTDWTVQLQADVNKLREHLDWLNNSAWTKLGRFLRILSWRADRLPK